MIAELVRGVLPHWVFDGLGAVVAALFLFGALASIIVQFMKVNHYIEDGEAGKWSGIINGVLVGLSFIAVQVIGMKPGELADIENLAKALFALATGPVLAGIAAKLYYFVFKFLGWFKSYREIVAKKAFG